MSWWFFTAQKMKFSVTNFFSKCDQIRRKLRIWTHLMKKSIMENLFLAFFRLFYPPRIKDTVRKIEKAIAYVFQKHHDNFAFQLFITLL